MSKLNIDQRTIKSLLADNRSDFLIPDYQRPYAWEEDECTTLWDDIFSFAFPENNKDLFNKDSDEYFLGPIVTFKNEDSRLEVIDGQQRLTTILLLLRAFYDKFKNQKDEESESTYKMISQCIWKTDEYDKPLMDELKIDSEVASDDDKAEFLEILKTGNADPKSKSKYAKAFLFFQNQVAQLVSEYPSYATLFARRLLNNVILLPIEAESQDTALRIFSTLNDRGLPLSDADIFKSQFYKFFSSQGRKDEFVKRWRHLEEVCEAIFKPIYGTPTDELFSRYMYYVRAKQGNRNTTTEALRTFYEKDHYALLKSEETLANLESLLAFWRSVDAQEGFSNRILRRLFVLNYAPNSMWTYFTSVYFMHNRNQCGELEEEAFYRFLEKITAFIWAYAIERPGVNALRSPVYPEMINIVNDRPVSFSNYLFDREGIRSRFENYVFTNGRPVTKSMCAWWAFHDDRQELMDLETTFEIEHIFARRRADEPGALSKPTNLEALGNKALLEKRINIRASDYRFEDKKKYYRGYVDGHGKEKPGTDVFEYQELMKANDFTEPDIENRTETIIRAFIDFLGDCQLLL